MARRIAQSSVNWIAISERVPEAEKAAYLAFKAKSDGYLRKMFALSPEAPKIDWAIYKNAIPIAGLVEHFEKQYNAVKIPYPDDKYSAFIDSSEKKTMQEIEEFKKVAASNIKKAELRIEEIENLLPYSQMTYEDAAYIEPDLTLDLENKPSFWPHQEIDYVFDEPQEEGSEKQKKS
ncbi:ATP synthase subunit d, mitochondrial-like [Daktulosphaira vitifoliae]|uniref:ATP synthase subunit d, mitochondrial-like n=1 Tax=Daktulosphaira vitifoliae TaxID=58002 RepID=UPI0021AAE21B|nr:ATP synthase subunit d, mitochondrial-like [Daktulosphaira vitifoliae]XP_050522091.1 ATP synthase subunit d, mitochondrial-like [Daktulosphaira vitifoliae]